MSVRSEQIARWARILVLGRSVLLFISSCGEEGGADFEQDSCEDVTCVSAPHGGCEGQDVVTYEAAGACVSGQCQYVGATRQTCSGETPLCFQGACTDQDPCEGITCDVGDAPPRGCDGQNVVAYEGDSGQCVSGVCEHDEVSPEACSGNRPFCVAGQCVDEEVQPPEPSGCVVDEQPQGEDSLEGDFQALQAIYRATGGENWTHNDRWPSMTPESMGDAYGVEVDDDGRVMSQTEAVLSIPSVSPSDAGRYRLRVTNPQLHALELESEEIEVLVN